MLEDFRLKVFMAVDRNRNFTAAARELGVSQPAISQNIAELEKNLNAQLFERTRSEVIITDKGRLFKEYASQILHWYRAAQDAFSEGSPSSPERVRLPLEDGREAEIWSSQGDLHIKLTSL